ncbi:protein of unknown function [Xenorhabdus doucetiae]|uniref:Uncharacterized protein n=1 Tax=Xenorhabdus doucetiae TaxID=351671 RepID=A0A068QPL4_9GAMM|nr:protein of unknown function [Xenorhabdus doucetiae]
MHGCQLKSGFQIIASVGRLAPLLVGREWQLLRFSDQYA